MLKFWLTLDRHMLLNLRQLKTTLREKRHIKTRQLSQIYAIIHSLGYKKVTAKWIPRLHTAEQENLSSTLSLQHLTRYRRQDFLHIVASDES